MSAECSSYPTIAFQSYLFCHLSANEIPSFSIRNSANALEYVAIKIHINVNFTEELNFSFSLFV